MEYAKNMSQIFESSRIPTVSGEEKSGDWLNLFTQLALALLSSR